MLLVSIFAAPLIAALLCLALSQAVPTRWLGVGASVACLIAGLLLVLARSQGVPELRAYPWAVLDDTQIWITLHFNGINWILALIVAVGGALALLSLALTLPTRLHGFGGLFAALVGALLATLAGLAIQELLLLTFAWVVAALMSVVAVRASGTPPGALPPPLHAVAGLLSALVVLGVALYATMAGGAPPWVLVCWILIGLLAFGAPPFHAVIDVVALVPSGIAGFLLVLGLPLLGGAALFRFFAAQTALPAVWQTVLLLVGLVILVACAAGALSERSMRRLAGWQFSAQLGVFLVALGRSEDIRLRAAPALLFNALLTTLATYLVIVFLERRAGTDDMAEIESAGPLRLPGLALLIAAAAAVGAPGTWGFWARWLLYGELVQMTPWAVPVMLSGSALMAVAYLAPVATVWRSAVPAPDQGTYRRTWPIMVAQLWPLIVVLPLLILGIAPQLGWQGLAAVAQDLPAAAPIPPPGMAAQVVSGGAALLLLVAPVLVRQRRPRRVTIDAEMRGSGMIIPQALGASLRLLGWLGSPGPAFDVIWSGLLWSSQALRRALALFEQRYYLAGFTIGMVIVILLLLQQ